MQHPAWVRIRIRRIEMYKRINRDLLLLTGMTIASISACILGAYSQSRDDSDLQGAAGEPYSSMPSIAPIGVRIGKYMNVPVSAQGPAVDPKKGIGCRIWDKAYT
jgi:hypothetical protein